MQLLPSFPTQSTTWLAGNSLAPWEMGGNLHIMVVHSMSLIHPALTDSSQESALNVRASNANIYSD